MFFTYILLSISMYSLQRQKSQVVEISPVVNAEVVKNKPKKSESVITETDQIINSGFEESDIVDINNPEGENEYYYDPELYEEISFEDNFDKEYWDDVGDSYFEDFIDSEDTQEIENPENSEVVDISENSEIVENSESIENSESVENISE